MITFFRQPQRATLYVVESQEALDPTSLDRLIWLFAGAEPLAEHELKGHFVGTRRELVTPWSTNAVEIVRNMNIPGVKRIEEFTDVATADAAYDPMLQHRYEGLDQSVFVTDFSAAPIASVTDIRAYNEAEGLALSEEEIVYRSGAQPTDLICVSGNLGAAYMGLQLLEREKRVFAGEKGDFEPDFAEHEYILERQLRPEARQDIILALREKGLRPTSMIDSSDGLASELLHLATESGVGVRIYEERLPIDIETHRMAEELNMSTTTVAMNGGEDFELIFTIPLAELDRLKELDGIHIIGHVTSPGQGCYLVTPDGAELRLRAQGWPDEAEE